MQIDPVWFLFILFILCFLMIKELYVAIVAKELVSHKVCDFISPSTLSTLFLVVTSPSLLQSPPLW